VRDVTAPTLAELAALVGGEVSGDGSLQITGVAPLEEAGPGQVSFFANKRYRAAFEASRAEAVIVGIDERAPAGRNLLRAANPYLAFAKVTTHFHPAPVAVAGISPRADVHPTARVDPTAQVGPFVSVGAGTVIGARTILRPGVQVGEQVRIGADCLLHANAVVREGSLLGDRVILQPGCNIGGDGFGFATDLEGVGQGPRHFKVPQSGIVVLEDDVEIGAGTCVDRAALGVTRVGRGTKIDNLVQVGHGVTLGPLCILAAGAAVAGSTRIGMGVAIWGQAGLVGHIEVGDRANISAQAGVMRDVAPGERLAGTPAVAERTWARGMAAMERFNDMRRDLIELKRKVAALEGGQDGEEA
jgi:UDP-3-O-[3-hydroxymyristoyl] glucosamine N-acyltransferase